MAVGSGHAGVAVATALLLCAATHWLATYPGKASSKRKVAATSLKCVFTVGSSEPITYVRVEGGGR